MPANNFLDIVDKHLQDWVDKGLNKLPIETLQPEMTDPKQNQNEKWKTWFPIKSKIIDAELDDFEKAIGFVLPGSYRKFLKHKHFYELHIGEASFCQHEVNGWRYSQTDFIFNSYPREFLIDKGYIPFAIWSDWGMLCFDTNKKAENNEYSVVQWDHENVNKLIFISSNFDSQLVMLDQQSKLD